MILEPVTCPWFLCMYVNVLPVEIVMRIWDCVLWEGNVVLFRVGLAICRTMVKVCCICFLSVVTDSKFRSLIFFGPTTLEPFSS